MTTDRIQKKALMVPLAAGGNVLTDTATRLWHITDAALVTQYSDILKPIPFEATNRKLHYLPSVAEVRQRVLLGRIEETILPSTRYKMQISNIFKQDQTAHTSPFPYAYTTPAALTGSADTDRYNLWYALAAKINAYAGNNVTAILVSRVAYTVGNTHLPVAGEVITDNGGHTATVAYVETSGAWAGAATGYIWLYSPSATFVAGAATFSGTGTATLSAVPTDGQAMIIVDDAGYYSQITGRNGISQVSLVESFTTSTSEVVVVGVVSRGIGTDMLKLVPVFDRFGQDIVNDVDGDQNTSTAPTAGKTYAKVMFSFDLPVDASGLMGFPQIAAVQEVIWLDETTPADVASFLAKCNTEGLVLTADQITVS